MKEYILTNGEAKQVDRYTIDMLGISGTQLMHKAGGFVSLKSKLLLEHVPGSRVDIFCGTGNNGGDGLVAAGDLYDWGAHVSVWIAGDPQKITGDALHFYQKCQQMGLKISNLQSEEDLAKLENLHETDLIIDALLGTGIKGTVRGIIAKLIREINQIECPVLAVDIPSGINGDTGRICGVAVKARQTVSMGFLKRGLLFNEGRKYAGEVILADLNYPEESFQILDTPTYLLHRQDLKNVFPAIPIDTYKHRMGKVLIYAGSPGMTGAATLTAKGALRSGAGLVVVAVPASLNPIFEVKLTEALTAPVAESAQNTLCKASLKDTTDRLEWSDVIAFGPGVSYTQPVMEFGYELIHQVQKPLIIDADGLRLFKGHLELIDQAHDLIITPHLGEFAFITGKPSAALKDDIIGFAKKFVQDHPCTLVLKGAPTVTVAPDGTVAVNSTGNPALATGGTGDVLTGLISAFRAQGLDSFTSAVSAVSIHGLAADQGIKDLGIRSFIAGDLLTYLPKVLEEFDRIEN